MADTRLPDGRVLTEEELDALKREARSWVRRMLESACIPCSRHAEEAVERAIAQIVGIYVSYGYVWNGRLELTRQGEQERRKVIDALVHSLESLCYAYAAAAEQDEDEKTALLLWLKGEYHGSTTDSRIALAVGRLSDSVAGIIEGDALSNGGIIPSDIAVAVTAVVGVKGIRRLLESEVTRGWQHKWGKDHGDAMFVHVFRGSSYPCDTCDDIVALGWQLVGGAIVPPIHPNCKCYTVYV